MANEYDGNKAMNGNNLYTFWQTIKGLITGWLATKQGTITGGATTITSDNLDTSRALISNSSGKVAVSAVTSTELGYLDGVTSSIQSQLNDKQATLGQGANIIIQDVLGSPEISVPTASTTGTDSSATSTLGAAGFALPDLTTDGTTTQDNNIDNYVTESIRGYNGIIHARKASTYKYGVVKLGTNTTISSNVKLVGVNSSGQLAVSVADTDISSKQDKIKVGSATSGAITTISAGSNFSISISSSTATLNTTPALLGQGYGTCSTAAATTEKAVSISNYVLTTGGIVIVKFSNSVPASATMNVNSKGAKAIYWNGSAITANRILAGDTCVFVYDGTRYNLVGTYVGHSDYQAPIEIGEASSGDVTSIEAGTNISITTSGGTATINNTYSYTLPVASDSALGGFKTGFTDADVSGDSVIRRAVGVMSQKAYVNIPYATDSVKGVAAYGSTMTVTSGVADVDTTSSALRSGLLQTSSDPGLAYMVNAESAATYADAPYVGYHVSYINTQLSGIGTALSGKAPLASPNFSGTPQIGGVNIATTADIASAITGAETFKGTLTSETALKANGNFTAGWYWRVSTAGSYVGQYCQVGDMIFCITTHTHTAGDDLTNANFSVVQTNVDFLTDTEIANIINSVA